MNTNARHATMPSRARFKRLIGLTSATVLALSIAFTSGSSPSQADVYSTISTSTGARVEVVGGTTVANQGGVSVSPDTPATTTPTDQTKAVGQCALVFTTVSPPPSLPGSGGTVILHLAVTSNCGTWTVTPEAGSWIKETVSGPAPTMGTQTYGVVINYPANPTMRTRTTTLTARSGSTGFATFTLSQLPSTTAVTGFLYLNPTFYSAKAGGEMPCIDVNFSFTSYRVTSDQPWVTGKPMACGKDNYGMQLTVAANPTIYARSATITVVTDLNGNATQTAYLTVQQAGASATVSVSPNPYVTGTTGAAFYGGPVVTTNWPSWTATTTDSWITVVTPTGVNGSTLQLSGAQNPTASERKGTVTVTAGTATKTFEVRQPAGAAPFVSPSVAATTADGAAQSVNLQITTNQTGWTASSDQSWLTLTRYSGVNGDWIVANLAQNSTGATRSGIVTFRAGTATGWFTVSQNPVPADTVWLTSTTWAPGSASTYTPIRVYTTPVSWTASTNQSWLTLSQYSGLTGTQISVYTSTNTSTSPRTGVVTVRAGTATQTITVTQAGAPVPAQSVTPTLSASTYSWTAAGTGDATGLTVTTNQGLFSIRSNNTSWLTVSQSSGYNGTYIVVTADRNPNATSRTGTLTITAGSAPAVTVTVTQLGAPPAPTLTLGVTYTAQVKAGGLIGFYVWTNQGTWTATSNQPWLSLLPSSGGNGAWMITGTEANNTGMSRTGVVTVRAGSQVAYYTVTQAG